MGTTYEDNLSLCRDYRSNVRQSFEGVKTFFLAGGATATLPAAVEVSVVNVERALNQFIAGMLGLTIDTEIFRGAIIPGKDGCAVSVNRLDLGRADAIPTVFALFECRDVDRDRVMNLTSALAARFPVQGMSVTVADGSTVTARRIDVISAVVDTAQADNGRIKTFGFVSFKVQL